MMRLLLVLVSTLLMSTVLRADISTMGGSDAWPWGSEIKFPWTKVQGAWAPADGEINLAFVFQAAKSNKIINIIQYNPSTCVVIATGVGVESDDVENVVIASMTGGGKSFDMTIRAFNAQDIRARIGGRSGGKSSRTVEENDNGGPTNKGPVFVMSLYPKGKFKFNTSFQITKITNATDKVCRRDNW